MPVTTTSRPLPLVSVGDSYTIPTAAVGIGFAPNNYAISLIEISGTFTAATFTFSAIPSQGPLTPVPLSIWQVDGNGFMPLPSGQVGPLTPTAKTNNGYLYAVLCPANAKLQVVLTSIGGSGYNPIAISVTSISYP